MLRTFTATLAGLGALAVAATAAPTTAATITFDFTNSGGTNSGTDFNNIRTYTATNADGSVTLQVRGFALVGSSNTLSNAQVGFFNGAGLGVCNQGEGTGCDSPNHQVDNSSSEDFLLLHFSPATFINQAVVVTFSSADTDVSYFLGNITGTNLAGSTVTGLSGLGFGAESTDNGGNGNGASNTITINLGNYNALLIAADLGERDDTFKLTSTSINNTPPPTTVPEPLTLSLFGTGLLDLGLVARRRRAA